jgi:hypothetical protein
LLRSRPSLGVPINEESIAQEYYPCLGEVTRHPSLRRICDKIVCGEEAHVR